MRTIRKWVQGGLLVVGTLALVLAWVLGQGVLLGVGVIALVVAVMLQPWGSKPPDEGTMTPWQLGSGPL